jgi:tetratricopeptide (TPR) repeat protein
VDARSVRARPSDRIRRPAGCALLLLALAAQACATGSRGPTGPLVNAAGDVYPPGTPPARTRFSQTAALFLVQGHTDRAVEIALEGIAADSMNPIHYFLAGAAQLRLDQYEDADRTFARAERLFPAYQLQIEPQRMAAWVQAYDRGVQAYEAGDTEGAMAAWRKAAVIYDLRSEAHRNLASLLARDAQYDEAIALYQQAVAGLAKRPATRTLDAAELQAREDAAAATDESLGQLLMFVSHFAEAEPVLRRQLARDTADVQVLGDLAAALKALGRTTEAAEIYSSLLSGRSMESADLFSLGVGLFRAGDYTRASEAFARLTTLRPGSRDAWFNYVNALLAGKAWDALARAGDRLVELDPLGKNVGLIAARAHLENGDEAGALQGIRRIDAAPVYVEGLQMQVVDATTRIQGRVVGNLAEAGSLVRLRFTFYQEAGELGTQIVEIVAPATGESTAFDTLFAMHATGFKYELVPAESD